MSTYSAFFSSGLTAAPRNVHSNDDLKTPTHSRPHSPVSDVAMSRSTTPTPASKAPQPRLRRRRSSLTLEASASPIHNIKSPLRNAAAAGTLQRRSRSGSLVMVAADVLSGTGASEQNSLTDRVGRMRSGSVGTVLRYVALTSLKQDHVLTLTLYSQRKHTRRNVSSFAIPAAAPPPTTPLPSIPRVPSISITRQPLAAYNSDVHTFSSDSKHLSASPQSPSLPDSDTEGEGKKTGRPRSYSLENGYAIDEEMREN